jgi:Toprim domain
VRQHADLYISIEYFAGRGLDGLDLAHLGALKVHGSLPYYAAPGDKPIPIGQYHAILAALTEGGQGEPVALQRTWLTRGPDGLPDKIDAATLREAAKSAGLAVGDDDEFPARKLTAGGCGRAAVWMGRPTDTVVIAEGVETALSAVDAGFYAAACCGVSRMHVLAMAPGIQSVVLAPDCQDVAEAAALKAAEAYAAQGFAVRIARLPRTKREGYDLNDLLRDEGPEAVQAMLDGAVTYVPPEAPTEPRATSDEDTSEQEVPSGLLDIPGAYGDLAHYLKDFDEYNDPIKALAVSSGIMGAVAAGYRVHGGGNTTHSDLLLVNIAASGHGKTRVFRRAAGILRHAVGERTLLRTSSLGTPEGLWDVLEETQRTFGLPALVLIVDEFGSELRKMADARSYKAGLLPMLRSLTNAATEVLHPQALSKRSKGPHREALRHPIFSMLGISTPTQFADALSARILEDGSEARMIVLVSPKGLQFDDTQVPEPEGLSDRFATIFERTVAAADPARSGGTPRWADVRVSKDCDALLREIRATQEREAAPLNEADNAWGTIIQRRRERIVKFALLWAVSENPADPELSVAGISWARGVVAYAEAGHRVLRGGVVPLGQRAQEEREVTDRVLSWLRQKCAGGKSVELRELMRSLNLPKAIAVTAVNTLIGQDRVQASGTVDRRPVVDLEEVPARGGRLIALRLGANR